MRILTLENEAFLMNNIPDEVDDLAFCVLDNSKPIDPDYMFIPLIFLESFVAPALVLRVGEHTIKMPVDWKVLIGEPDVGDLEVLALTSMNDRGFKAFTCNPLGAFRPEFMPIDIVDAYNGITWYFPKLKSGQMLCVPLEDGEDPPCAFFVKEITRQCEVVDVQKIWL